MLKFLSVRDFIIVSSLELDFSAGFTALTGETGAGKSILIGALSLALGERGDVAMVRNGCERAEIAAEFDITTLPQLHEAGEQLHDIHGQHAHQSLLRPDMQRVLLDGYAGVTADAQQVSILYRDWQVLRRRRISLSENAGAVAAERELLQFQRDEIGRAHV